MINTLNKEDKGRFFLVGCPRSGTTLLTSFLAAHSQIAAFPETHFFQVVTGQYEERIFASKPQTLIEKFRHLRAKLRIMIGIAHPAIERPQPYGGIPIIHNFLTDINREDLKHLFPKNYFFIRQNVNAYFKIMDILTIQEGKKLWIDKSTVHLNYIDILERFVPNTKVIHIVRNGKDVVSSIYDAAQKYPGTVWSRVYYNLDRCIDIWNVGIQITHKYLHQPNHKLVRYENLVKNPESTLRELCDFLEVDFDKKMILERNLTAQKVSGKNELWKTSVKNSIQDTSNSKFYQLFEPEKQQYIQKRLLKIDC